MLGHSPKPQFVRAAGLFLETLLRYEPPTSAWPDINGYELVETLRFRANGASLPAIALTGHGRSQDVQHAFDAGFQAHISKPVDLEQMKTVIATVVRGELRGSRDATDD